MNRAGLFKKRLFILVLIGISIFAFDSLAKKAKAFRFPVETEGSPSTGNPKAPVTIVEVSDFECPFCAMAQPTLQKIRERYPDQVRLVFKHFPLAFHEHARGAHIAAMCANEQGKFWDYRSRLFESQRALEHDQLIQYAQELGLDKAAFVTCLDSEKYLTKIEEDREEVLQYGIQGTPSFFVNGRLLPGAQPFSSFEQLIEEELQDKD